MKNIAKTLLIVLPFGFLMLFIWWLYDQYARAKTIVPKFLRFNSISGANGFLRISVTLEIDNKTDVSIDIADYKLDFQLNDMYAGTAYGTDKTVIPANGKFNLIVNSVIDIKKVSTDIFMMLIKNKDAKLSINGNISAISPISDNIQIPFKYSDSLKMMLSL